MTRKITVLLTDDEFGRFQDYCDLQGFKKSTLIARMIRDLLETENVGRRSSRRARSKLPGIDPGVRAMPSREVD